MSAADTNVLVRILVDDPEQPEQVTRARDWAEQCGEIFVSQVVQVELVWVLESAYDVPRAVIAEVLSVLLENDAFLLQNESSFAEALSTYRRGKADFSDCIIRAESLANGHPLVTFDRKFSRLDGVELL